MLETIVLVTSHGFAPGGRVDVHQVLNLGRPGAMQLQVTTRPLKASRRLTGDKLLAHLQAEQLKAAVLERDLAYLDPATRPAFLRAVALQGGVICPQREDAAFLDKNLAQVRPDDDAWHLASASHKDVEHVGGRATTGRNR